MDNPNAVPGNPESNEPVKQETAADVTEKLIALEAEAVQLSKTLAAFHDKLVENGIGTSVVAEAAFTLYITARIISGIADGSLLEQAQKLQAESGYSDGDDTIGQGGSIEGLPDSLIN